jgi:hypothetical protein
MTRLGMRVLGSDRRMKHAASRELYAHWQDKRGVRPAPERTDIDPGAIRGVLADAFILGLDDATGHPVRLAGTRLCALFGREVKGQPFLDFWALSNRATMEGLLTILRDECTGTVAAATARNEDGDPVELELLLLPLSVHRPVFARAIGILAPLKTPSWLGASKIGPVTLGGRRHVGATVENRLLPRFTGPRGRPGLVVFEGGRSRATASEDGPTAA